ncbi:hypothetical protein SAMN04488127_1994 [Bhargavaea ginsengi]|uniref:NYN domain-containing protein n=1 Tax=Bhargavaea ginsengi TaxID=426757 RepID=A0A1H6Z7U2_9BACL|nr:NYN domain-containing protein [Bhargavaea ginsengi]MCM3086935.1 NYN domain-containing protein [Bhargavaea ginsengi]SEJ49633.1 hypothetical protein SAMN04488127_1994 [Bhargavaea ginsengi]
MDVLIVDGYNIIGAWPELKNLRDARLEDARDLLVEMMAEYRAYTGWRVIVVFDAQYVPGIPKPERRRDVEVVFTRENETADERIERLASELGSRRTQVHVATSDYTEQRIIFAQGALRKSARELRLEMGDVRDGISKRVREIRDNRPFSKIPLSDEVAEIFEKWRRGHK